MLFVKQALSTCSTTFFVAGLLLSVHTPTVQAQTRDTLRPQQLGPGVITTLPAPAPGRIEDDTLRGSFPSTNTSQVLSVPSIAIRDENIVKSYFVELPFNKTVSIIFPAPVRSVDLGSRDIIADKASDVENVLKVKAAKIGFNETNFSVITTDGKFWSFVANYAEFPMVLALNLAVGEHKLPGAVTETAASDREVFINGKDNQEGSILFAGVRSTQSEIVYNSNKVMGKGRSVRHLGVEENYMLASVRGFYVKDNVMYIKLRMKNKSNISYDIDYLRFFIVDKDVAKRTTHQEREIAPLYVHNGGITTIKGHNTVDQVFAFQKFTIPDDKRILVQLNELNGGRALTFVMNNEDIMNSGRL